MPILRLPSISACASPDLDEEMTSVEPRVSNCSILVYYKRSLEAHYKEGRDRDTGMQDNTIAISAPIFGLQQKYLSECNLDWIRQYLKW